MAENACCAKESQCLINERRVVNGRWKFNVTDMARAVLFVQPTCCAAAWRGSVLYFKRSLKVVQGWTQGFAGGL